MRIFLLLPEPFLSLSSFCRAHASRYAFPSTTDSPWRRSYPLTKSSAGRGVIPLWLLLWLLVCAVRFDANAPAFKPRKAYLHIYLPEVFERGTALHKRRREVVAKQKVVMPDRGLSLHCYSWAELGKA